MAYPLITRPPAPATGRKGPGLKLTLGVAALHAGVIAALCLVMPPPPVAPPPELSVPMVFEPPAPPPVMELPPEILPPPSAQPRMASLEKLPALDIPAAPDGIVHQRPHVRRAPVKAPAPPTALADAQPAPQLAAPATRDPPRPAGPSAAQMSALAALKARIRQAVQEAATSVYPAAARLMHREGRPQVQFEYENGVVRAVTLASSSQSSLLDRAAIQAVANARMPSPPAELGPQKLSLLVAVNFTLTAEE